MSKILVLIDGFNFYHRLKDYQSNNNVCVKWLDYKKLILSYFDDKEKNIFECIYFSAIAEHRGEACIKRHKTYIDALEKTGIKTVFGKFKIKHIPRCGCDERCKGCSSTQEKTKLTKHEEKNTDVNIAITLLEKAIKKEYDSCYILSSDSDFNTAIQRAKEVYPEGRIVMVPPPLPNNKNRRGKYFINSVIELTKSRPLFVSWEAIKKSQFPDNYEGLKNPWC